MNKYKIATASASVGMIFSLIQACMPAKTSGSSGVLGDASELPPEATVPPKPRRVGFYVFDGANTDESVKNAAEIAKKTTSMNTIFRRAQVKSKAYFGGATHLGENLQDVIDHGQARICNDWRSGKIDEVALSGYSRGGPAALGVAVRLMSEKGCAFPMERMNPLTMVSMGTLKNLFAAIERTDRPVISKIALVDAVNLFTGSVVNEDSVLASIPENRRPKQDSKEPALCYHFINYKAGQNGPLNSMNLEKACETVRSEDKILHQQMNDAPSSSKAMESWLSLKGEKSENLTFGDGANAFKWKDSYAELCSIIKDLSACVSAACSWNSNSKTCVAPEEKIVSRFEQLFESQMKNK